MYKKSKFLTFIFSFIPGAGQMYQGRLKRGASIMLIFFTIIGTSVLTYFMELNFLLPVLWFYSFFDSINRMNLTTDELEALGDKPIFDLSEYNRTLSGLFSHKNVFAGSIIIFIGLIMIYNSTLKPMVLNLDRIYGLYISSFIEKIPSFFVAAIIIALGIRMIIGEKKEK